LRQRASFAGTKFGGGGTPVVERFAFTTGQEARAGKNSWWTSTLQPPSFLPARAKIIKSQRPDFREKKFGFCSGQTAIPCQGYGIA